MASARYFSPELFKFLSELRAHNNRDWFQKNKERYEAQVRDPMLLFIADLGPGLRRINPNIVADPNPTRGSMMRIYRDIRFSEDKSPYKTFVAAHFWNRKGKDGGTPGYYLRLAPGGSLIGGGIWHPEPPVLKKIRDAIVDDPKGWKRIRGAEQLTATCEMAGESLKTAPRGYDANHPLIEDIKRKDFTVGRSVSDREVIARDFLDRTLDTFRKMAPFVAFLSEALDLP
jgi:uncharacterized protein (TIGR02453 family)